MRSGSDQVETVAEFFDGQADSWHDLYILDASFQRRFQVLSSVLQHELSHIREGTALDAGCGSGVFSAYLARRGWRVKAVDASEKMLVSAGGRLRSVSDRVSLHWGRIDDLPFPDQSFELILCFSAVEYVRDDEAVFSELARVLRPSGLLFLTVPNRRSIVRIVERTLARSTGALSRSSRDGRYLKFQEHQYVPSVLDRRLSEHGFALRSRRFWSVGLAIARPRWLLRVLERASWAGMYCGVYVKERTRSEKR
jgi:2-polyprenyl-3-methyl-5-hydroxy-6-metoxy-1,4-benzoquinol methylase